MTACHSSGIGSARKTGGSNKLEREVRRQEEKLIVSGCLQMSFFEIDFCFSFKQLPMSSELYMAVQRSSWKSWKRVPSGCTDQQTYHTAFTAELIFPRRKRKQENGRRTAAVFSCRAGSLWNYFSSSDFTLSLPFIRLSTAESVRLVTLLFPLQYPPRLAG